MSDTRIEKDSMGPIAVPATHLWGAQTQRSLEHFRISEEKNAGRADHGAGTDQTCGSARQHGFGVISRQ
ncbi:hypothetical protein OS31_08160 [Dickeya oryzae]